MTVINGHRLLVEITHKQFELSPMAETLKRRVNIGFDDYRGAFSVGVSIDEHPAQTIPMDADENHCFLKARNSNREITPDELAELALKDALFTPRDPTVPQSPAPKTGVWS